MKISIPSNILVAVSSFVDIKDERKYLRGIYIVVKAHGYMDIVATNGGVLGKFSCPCDVSNFKAIIPLDVISFIKKHKGNVELELDGDVVNVTAGTSSAKFTCIDGVYPDYTRVLPKTVTDRPANYDVDWLNLIVKANKALGAKNASHVQICQNGSSAGKFTLHNSINLEEYYFEGCIMPMVWM
ncbi:MAG: hypothetical protein E6R13_01485 [Spirochaetes bacterium]|nr:MAG: hypothetical protein E6R13_01485 [Spirochaetota bacterium]